MNSKAGSQIKLLSKDLCHLDYEDIEARIETFPTDLLIALLNSSSRRVGDSAISCLGRRTDGEGAVIDAIIHDRLTRKDSKVRGTNFLTFRGSSYPDAIQAYFHLLDDKNEEVTGNALFGIVFAQNKQYLPRLREKHASLEPGTWLLQRVTAAIEGIEEENPFIYSPYYADEPAAKVWGLADATAKRHAANKRLKNQRLTRRESKAP